MFLVGFVAGMMGWEGSEWFWPPMIGLVVLAATAVLIGLNATPATAAFLSAGMTLLSLAVLLEGGYVAHLSGWGGLEVRDFGSDDWPGQAYVAISFVAGSMFLPVVALFAAGLAWFVATARLGRRPRGTF